MCLKVTNVVHWQDLDDTHMFIAADIIETLQDRIDDLMDQMSFTIAEK